MLRYESPNGQYVELRNRAAHEAAGGGAGCETKWMSNAPQPNPEKPTEEWVTGDEPMTGPQTSYLKTLCREAGVEFEEGLTKAEASRRIEELQVQTGRGKEDEETVHDGGGTY